MKKQYKRLTARLARFFVKLQVNHSCCLKVTKVPVSACAAAFGLAAGWGEVGILKNSIFLSTSKNAGESCTGR
jgi:hypothetical protein